MAPRNLQPKYQILGATAHEYTLKYFKVVLDRGFPIWKFSILEKSQDYESESMHSVWFSFPSMLLVNDLNTFSLSKSG